MPIDKIYQMMVNTRYEGASVKCCKHHGEEGHLISQCKGLCNKGMQMINQGLLRVEKTTSEDVFIMKAPTKKICRVQFTAGGPPKLILSKPAVTHKEDCSALPYNYGYSFQST